MKTYRVIATYNGAEDPARNPERTLADAQAEMFILIANFLRAGYSIMSIRDVEVALAKHEKRITFTVQEVKP